MSLWNRVWLVLVHYCWQSQFVDYKSMMLDVGEHFFDTSYQQRDRIRELLCLPLHEIARRCDWVCFWAIVWLDYKWLAWENGAAFDKWNITSVGNVARCVLSSEDLQMRIKCLELLRKYEIWINS